MAENKTQSKQPDAVQNPITMDYLLTHIEVIASETAYIHEALDALTKQPSTSAPGDIAGQARAEAIARVVACRETTNQTLLEFYRKVYEDSFSPAADAKERALRALERAADDVDKLAQLNDLLDTIRHIDH